MDQFLEGWCYSLSAALARDAHEERRSLSFIWSVSFVWLNQTDRIDQMNQINQFLVSFPGGASLFGLDQDRF